VRNKPEKAVCMKMYSHLIESRELPAHRRFTAARATTYNNRANHDDIYRERSTKESGDLFAQTTSMVCAA